MKAMQGFRLSPQQRRLWNSAKNGTPQRCQCALVLEGEFDPSRLRELIDRLIARHEILRTRFYRQPGLKIPLQVIERTAPAGWHEVDLQPLASRLVRERVERELVKHRQTTGTEADSRLDVLIMHLEPAKHIISLALPAMCCDTASLTILACKIEDHLAGQAGIEDEIETVQYLQFSEWQNDLLEGQNGVQGIEYWQSIAGRELPNLQLPFVTYGNDPAGEHARVAFSISEQPLSALETCAAMQGVSMSALLLACWQTLLWRLTGATSIGSGYVCAGRNFAELKAMLGPCATTVPIQLHFEEGLLLDEVVRRVEARLNEAMNQQEYFLLSDPPQVIAGQPWPTLFEYAIWPLPQANGLPRVSLHSYMTDTDPFLLKLRCTREPENLRVELIHDPKTMGEEVAQTLLAQFRVLADHAAENLRQPIGELQIVSSHDQKRIDHLRQTAMRWPAGQDVMEMFDARVAETPQANAVTCGGNTLTYIELQGEASRLAWYLAAHGVETESRVVLFLPRSELMVISLMGVLKAGAAYVPVEPDTPMARLHYLIKETGAVFIITLELYLPLLHGLQVTAIVLDRDQEKIAACSPIPAPQIFPENLAYILFTSGSTGTPKGVAVERRQLRNYLLGVMERLRFEPGSQLAMVSSFAADLGNTVLFPALCGGGCVHVIDPQKVSDPDAMAEYFERHKIQYLKIVPPHLSVLLSSGRHVERVIPRSALVCGGQALPWQLVDRVAEVAATCRILNHYGPTETTVGVMTYEVEADESRWGPTVPLGLPLPNVQVYILDEKQRPVSTGVPGELYIGGSCVSRGYWCRADLTAERFVPDLWSSEAGARMYRTGDLVRLLPDGNVEYLGRLDRQVKVRGYRVELGEIEAAILLHETVQQVAVELVRGEDSEDRLVAFIAPAQHQRPTPEQLRSFLRSTLPEQSVPSAFVVIDRFPLTTNGKIDHAALKSHNILEHLTQDSIAPREMGEELLAGLWREVLQVSRVGIHDNFFQLGGDSLIATQLISRIRKLFQVMLPVRLVFDAPTVAGMAVHINQALSDHLQPDEPIKPVDRNGELELSFGQERLWGIQQMDPFNYAYNTISTWKLKGLLNEDALHRALNEIVRRHEVLRTTFSDKDGKPRLIIHPVTSVDLQKTDLTGLNANTLEGKIEEVIKEHLEKPFDLERGPLLRLKLLNIGDETAVLLVGMHHIIIDGWSRKIFIRELTSLYDCYSRNCLSPLSELPIQYADFAAWQRQYLQGEVLESLLAYWKRQLAGAPEALNFPTDYPRPMVADSQGSYLAWRHSADQVAQLKQLSRDEGVTLFMTLLAAYYVFLHAYTGEEDIVIGTDVANRSRIETESLIGFFVNNLPLRTPVTSSITFRELLDRVRTTTLGAYVHQDLPFSALVKALRPKRSLNHTPLFQTLFFMENNNGLEIVPEGLEAASVSAEITTSKFEIALQITEDNDGLTARWTYRTELFNPETIVEIAKDFNEILANIPQHVDSPLNTLLQAERNPKHGKDFKRSLKTFHSDKEELNPSI